MTPKRLTGCRDNYMKDRADRGSAEIDYFATLARSQATRSSSCYFSLEFMQQGAGKVSKSSKTGELDVQLPQAKSAKVFLLEH